MEQSPITGTVSVIGLYFVSAISDYITCDIENLLFTEKAGKGTEKRSLDPRRQHKKHVCQKGVSKREAAELMS